MPPTARPRSSGAQAPTRELLVGRAEEGDADALEALAGIGRLLGAAIGSFVNMFEPGLVVVGGGFGIAAVEFLVPAAPRSRAARRSSRRRALRIVAGELGSDAGLIGAGLVALRGRSTA